jgi:hypothetical protein
VKRSVSCILDSERFGLIPLPASLLKRPFPFVRKLLALSVFFAVKCSAPATTVIDVTSFDALSEVDTNGDQIADSLFGSSIYIGEGHGGIVRSFFFFGLPAIPQGLTLQSANLELYFDGAFNAGSNASFASPQIYHDVSQNSFALSDTSFSDPAYTPTGVYLPLDLPTQNVDPIDITSIVSEDYADDGSSPFTALRFQVDGLNYSADGIDASDQFSPPESFVRLSFAEAPEPSAATLLICCSCLLPLTRLRVTSRHENS